MPRSKYNPCGSTVPPTSETVGNGLCAVPGNVAYTTCADKQNHLSGMSFRPERSGVEESTQVAEITDARSNLLLGKIPPLRLRCGRNDKRFWFGRNKHKCTTTAAPGGGWRQSFVAPTYIPVGNTIHPHGLYCGRSRNGTQAVPYILYRTNPNEQRRSPQ